MVRRNDDETPPRGGSASRSADGRPAPSEELAGHLARLAGLRAALVSLAREERQAAAVLRRALLQTSEQAFATETLRRLVRARPELALSVGAGLGALLGPSAGPEPSDLAPGGWDDGPRSGSSR